MKKPLNSYSDGERVFSIDHGKAAKLCSKDPSMSNGKYFYQILVTSDTDYGNEKFWSYVNEDSIIKITSEEHLLSLILKHG